MGTKEPRRISTLTSKYYEVVIHETCAQLFRDNFTTFNREVKSFKTIEEVKAYLDKRYPQGTKRVKMFVDIPGMAISGIQTHAGAEHVGYIYQFRNSEQWNQHDWVEVRELVATPILL